MIGAIILIRGNYDRKSVKFYPDFLIYLAQLLCVQAEAEQKEVTGMETEIEAKACEGARNKEADGGNRELLNTGWLEAERAGYEVTLRELGKRLSTHG